MISQGISEKKDFKNILKYSEIGNYKSIQQLLPRNKSWKIILIEDEYNSGHCTLLLRYNNTLEWFNSYGTFPSAELDFISHQQKAILDQDVKHLNILLKFQVFSERGVWFFFLEGNAWVLADFRNAKTKMG